MLFQVLLTYNIPIFIFKEKTMGCKNCKSKKAAKDLSSEFVKNSEHINDSLLKRKQEILNTTWDKSMGSLLPREQIILGLFAWSPLIIGYYTIIKFFIDLF